MSERVSEHSLRRTSLKDDRRSSRRTSAATSTRSNKSSISAKTAKDGPLTPESPQVRVTRKRAAETMEDAMHETDSMKGEQQMSPSHTRGSSGDSRDSTKSVCLCQPDPKIPRPRNAFILYRQHHQAAVAAQNPGLANPEISKIIGEQWRSQAASVKNEWKQLAEEEKLRHQRQYPEYRYRPRRGDRRGSITGSESKGSPADKHRCQKCGGRSITTISPNTTSAPGSAALHQHPLQHQSGPPATPVSRYLPAMNGLSLNSHHARRARGDSAGLRINAAASRQYMPEEVESSSSPDAKRRRCNGHQSPYAAVRPPAGPGTPYYAPPLNSALHPMQPRRDFLPPPADLFRTSPPNTGGPLMGPPPTPGRGSALPISPFAHDSARHPGWERMSLTFPPLQNVSSPSVAEARLAPTAAADDSKLRERRSVEAMVMSMSYLGKLKILRKIAPPVGVDPTTLPPNPAIPKPPRGAIVAVEGFNGAAVSELVDWLEPFLSKADDHEVKVWHGPRVPDWKSKASINDMLGVVREWHERSTEIAAFIQPSSRTSGVQDRGGEDADMAGATPTRGQPSEQLRRPPVALLKSYTLQACDRYACAIPIQDAYSPADHWQWMATLWRGIPGADIIVYIKEVDGVAPPPDTAEKSGAGVPRVQPDKSKVGTVEIVEEAGLKCLLLWKETGKEIEGGALRRLGFELGEWIRSFGTL